MVQPDRPNLPVVAVKWQCPVKVNVALSECFTPLMPGHGDVVTGYAGRHQQDHRFACINGPYQAHISAFVQRF